MQNVTLELSDATDRAAGIKATASQFSLVKGGPTYQLFRRTGLCDSELEPPFRRAAIIALVAWLPLLILSAIEGNLRGGITIPFINDIENHVRFLIALPLLLFGETIVQRLLSPRIANFVTRQIVRNEDLPKFTSAVDKVQSARDSWIPEILILATVWLLGGWVYRSQIASAAAATKTWYASPDDINVNLTFAGLWLAAVSLPIFQFILVRWFWRLCMWSIFLARVSKLDLNLVPLHSDRVAGIGFLNTCVYSFGYGLAAQGALLSGYIAGRILHFGGSPLDFKLEAALLVLFCLATILLPLMFFTPQLLMAKWARGGTFGTFASVYVREFEKKWLRDGVWEEDLLGTPDLQALADLGNSHTVIRELKTVPFSATDIMYLAAIAAAPLLPLLLFVYSLEELVEKLLNILM